MIYEMRIDTLRPGKTYEYLSKLADAMPRLQMYATLEGCWNSDDDTAYSGFGTLNQVVHVWSYRDHAHRAEALRNIQSSGGWGNSSKDILVGQEIEILLPAPFMKQMEPQAKWSMYELAIDTFQEGSIDDVMKAWEIGLPDREKHGPLAACWISDTGRAHRVVHLWGCPGLRNRERIRNQSWKPGVWPPAREYLVAQENRLLIPTLYTADEQGKTNVAADLATTSPTYVPPPVAGKAPGL